MNDIEFKKISEKLLENERQSKNLKQNGNIVIPSLISLTLSACGGGGGGGGPITNPSPANRSPVAAADSTVTLDEDADATELNISAPTDPDTGDTLSITVDSVPTGGEIRTASGELVTEGMSLTINELTGLTFTPNENVNSDINTIGSFSYTVSDQAGGRDSSTVSFTINAIQDPPTIVSLIDVAIEENTTSVMTVVGEDPDGDTLTYSISGGEDGSLFQIDSSTGELSFIEKPDYEDPKDADKDNIYSVEVTVDDGNGNTASQTIIVTVNDVQSRMTLSSRTIDENDQGANIGTLETVFDDTLPSGTVNYSISGTGSENFEVIDGELKIKDGVQLNFESKSNYSLTITATNQNGTTTSFQFTITVNDVNDLPSNIELASDSLQGDLDGAIIGEITVTDEDAGETFTYAVNDDRFEIIEGVLRLKSDQSISSANASIDLIITVTDSQGGEYEETVTIIVGGIKLDNYSLNENSDGSIVGKIIEVRGIDNIGVTYTLSGEDARYFELSNDGTLKLKDGIELDFERDNDYQVLITATNSDGESLKSTVNIAVNDIDEPIEAATYIFGRNGQLSVDSIWLKNDEDNWYTSNATTLHITVPEKDSDEEIYLFSIDLKDDENGSYNLVVKSVSGFDVSSFFRFDAETGAVYLKSGSAIDFENSTAHYHAGTDALSYGVNGPDEDVSSSVRPLIFSLEDESTSVDITYSGNLSSNPVYIVLDFGDTSDDGSLELGREMSSEGLVTINNDYGEIVASAGGKDVTGDGSPDTVLLINVDNTWLDLVIIPGGQDIDGNVNQTAYLVTYWNYTFGYIPTDMDLGDINGDGFADIILGFGNDTLDYDYDGDGSTDLSDGMVEIVHGASLQSLVNEEVQWTTFLAPNGSDSAEFGADIAIGDFNNDGFDDILVGAPLDGNAPLLDSDEGAFHIIYGQSDLKINTYDGGDLYDADDYGVSIQLSSVYSPNSESEMGDSVAVGDFNGDGIDDLAVSSNEAGLNDGNEGIVTIYLGQNFGDPQEAVVINGNNSGSYMGYRQGSLQNLGDINGDGFDDLGIRDYDDNFFIVWGQSSWSADYDLNGDGINDVKLIDSSIQSSLDGEYLSGTSIGSFYEFKGIGDVNGDGFDDILVVAPYANWDSNYSGSEYGVGQIIFGQSNWLGELSDTIYSSIEIKGNESGLQIISMGDYDNDGLDEFAFTNGYGTIQDLIIWSGQDDIDQSQPEPVLKLDQNTVEENSLGATIGSISFLNLGDDESVDFSSIQIQGAYSNLFTISEDGELKLKSNASLDYEKNNDFVIQLSGITSGGNSFSKNITIQVVDVNEEPAFNLSSAWVKDNDTGPSVGSVIIGNLDQFDTYTYEISGTDAEYFEIDNEGKLKFKDSVTTNFSNKASYNLTISVTDASGLNVSEDVLIEVNSAPTDLDLSNINFDESQRGIEIGSVNVTDPNINDSYTYEISGEDADMFEVTSDGTLKLKDNVYADYEIKSSLNVTIKVIDQGGLSVSKDFTVNVNDLAYATPYASDIQSQSNVAESSNSLINAMLFGIRLDVDGDNSIQNTITYSVVTASSVFSDDYRQLYTSQGAVDPSQGFIDAVDRAFALISSVTGINFVKVIETETQVGDIRIGLTDNMRSGVAGFSMVDLYGINDYYNDSGDSDIWMANADFNTDGDWADGTFGFNTLIHEIGHSLGLKHPHNAFYPNSSGFNSPLMPLAYDAQYYTVMAYRDYVGDNLMPSPDGSSDGLIICGTCGQVHGDGSFSPSSHLPSEKPIIDDRKQIAGINTNLISIHDLEFEAEKDLYTYSFMETADGDEIFPYTPMFFDIWALRYLYSVNQNTDTWFRPDTNSGDDIYFIEGPVSFTIFDTGGIDTIDFSTLSLDSEINLNSILSFIGTDEITYDNGEFSTGYIIGIYYFNEMENVRAGSGSDSITCNVAVNEISCGPGDDSVYGISTGDSAFGDNGDDTFYYDSNDFALISGGAGRDRLDISSQLEQNPIFDLASIQGEIEAVEEVYLGLNETQNIIKLTVDSIKNFVSQIDDDQDSDGDPDTAIYILGDNEGSFRDLVVVTPDEGWTYLKSSLAYDFYQSADGETYFITRKGMGVYEVSSDAGITISNQTLRENIVNGEVGTISLSGSKKLSPDDDVIKFTLSGADADKFEITDEYILRLKPGTKADFENQSSYSLTITIGDVTSELVITVTDAEENNISGSTAAETLNGTDVDDIIDSKGGEDDIDGKDGIDTLLILDQSSNYEIETLAGITKIKALDSASGPYLGQTITVRNVENIEFSDTMISIDATLNDATYFYGNGSSETLNGTDGDDVFDPDGGSDEIDGKDGVDTVLIFDQRDNYEITISDNVVSIIALDSATGDYAGNTIKLTNIETIIFSDQTVQVSDLTSKNSTSRLVDGEDNQSNDVDVDTDTVTNDSNNGIIVIPDDNQWVNDFDLSIIDLPITADDIDHGLIDPNESINELILIEDSMELNFDLFSGDDALIIGNAKPLNVQSIECDLMIPLENINDQVVWEDWNYQSI